MLARAQRELLLAQAALREKTDELARAQASLRAESRMVELLHGSGGALSAKLELGTLAQTLTDTATQLSGARFGAFVRRISSLSGAPASACTVSGIARADFEALLESAAGQLFRLRVDGSAIVRRDDLMLDLPGQAGSIALRAYLAVPVVSGSGQVLGDLFFCHDAPDAFSARTERIVAGVAAQAAVALDNARLHEAAQRGAAERELLLASERAARTEAERMAELKDEFLATLSHELRTPLSAILGWSQVLRYRVRNEADLHKGLATIERNARAQARLIEDLLDMNRITSGKVRLDIELVEPLFFIEAAVETVRLAAEAKGVELEMLLDPGTGAVAGDAGRLQQVVWNLLSNAVKFTPKGGKVQIVLADLASHLSISVIDTGLGIAPAFLAHVFERFRQADGSTTRQYGGLGLGLAIVKSLVELHGGSMSASSGGVGKGATFTVLLPLQAAHRPRYDAALAHAPAAADLNLVDLSDIAILLVDDEPDARELIKRVLADCGAEVQTAGSAQEALALLDGARPDVLVSAIGMADMDGFELLRHARAKGGAMPAIALTAFARSEDRARILRAGFAAHIAKPVDLSRLISAVAEVVRRGQL